jgi:EmrB/QacA subfamily drug resistance transporter
MKQENTSPQKTILVTLLCVCFMIPFTTGALNVALPTIGNEFAMDAVLLSWVTTAFLLASVIFIVPFGRIADIYGRKKVFLIGIIAFTVTSLLQTVATSGIMLIVFQFVLGAAASMILGTYIAILISSFPAGQRGRVLGYSSAAVYFFTSSGPFLGGLLTQYFGWRSIYITDIPVGLLVIVLIIWKMKGDWVESKGEKFDIVGSVIYSLTLIAVVYGFTRLPGPLGIWLIVIGVMGFTGFIIWEKRVSSPVIEFSLFLRNKAFTFSCMASLINYGTTWGVSFLISLYLQYIKGFNPQEAGFILVCQPIIQTLFSPLAGRLSDKIEPRVVASSGMALTLIGLLSFVFLTRDTSLPLVIAGLVMVGFGLAFFVSPNTNAAMGFIESKQYGVASATLATVRQLGMVFSMGLIMLLFALFIGSVRITPEYHGMLVQAVNIAFIIFAVLSFIGIFASLARGKKPEIR